MELEEKLQGMRDLIIANQNGLLTLMSLIASQPQIDHQLLEAELEQALGSHFAKQHPLTESLLNRFQEVLQRRRPEM